MKYRERMNNNANENQQCSLKYKTKQKQANSFFTHLSSDRIKLDQVYAV